MRTFLFALVAVLLVGDGLVHGLWTGRWQTSHAMEDASARLASVPMTFEGWQGKAGTLPPQHVEQAGFKAYFLRTYQGKSDTVTVTLACGPVSSLGVHTPEVCFAGRGFEQREVAVREDVSYAGKRAEFWKARYEKPDVIGVARQEVFWAWYAARAWQASSSPRWDFAGQPVLHKLYVVCPVNSADGKPEDALCKEFLARFLPEVDKVLSPSGS
jgi:hypothetical protein